MKTIFEQETEIGKCDYEPSDVFGFKYAEPDYSTIYVHTRASLNGAKGLLVVEQHCYLRHGEEVPEQPWVKPAVSLEPAPGTKEEMIEIARKLHEAFIERVHNQFPEQYLVNLA